MFGFGEDVRRWRRVGLVRLERRRYTRRSAVVSIDPLQSVMRMSDRATLLLPQPLTKRSLRIHGSLISCDLRIHSACTFTLVSLLYTTPPPPPLGKRVQALATLYVYIYGIRFYSTTGPSICLLSSHLSTPAQRISPACHFPSLLPLIAPPPPPLRITTTTTITDSTETETTTAQMRKPADSLSCPQRIKVRRAKGKTKKQMANGKWQMANGKGKTTKRIRQIRQRDRQAGDRETTSSARFSLDVGRLTIRTLLSPGRSFA